MCECFALKCRASRTGHGEDTARELCFPTSKGLQGLLTTIGFLITRSLTPHASHRIFPETRKLLRKLPTTPKSETNSERVLITDKPGAIVLGIGFWGGRMGTPRRLPQEGSPAAAIDTQRCFYTLRVSIGVNSIGSNFMHTFDAATRLRSLHCNAPPKRPKVICQWRIFVEHAAATIGTNR